jgi:triacylglycerol lipase
MKFSSCLCMLLLILPSLSMAAEDACVIMLHGMGRTSFSLSAIEDALEEQRYQVWNDSYPGLSHSVEELSAPAIEAGLAYCRERQAATIHFVTHSLGGILVRYYLQTHRIIELGRIVMLAPPNRGSEVTDQMKDGFLYQTVMGPAGQELGTDEHSLPNSLGPIDGEIGIIAGKTDEEPWLLPEIPGDDDGKVAVERTKLPEMKDFLLVNVGHTFIMDDDEVIRQVLHFLQHGVFDRTGPVRDREGDE